MTFCYKQHFFLRLFAVNNIFSYNFKLDLNRIFRCFENLCINCSNIFVPLYVLLKESIVIWSLLNIRKSEIYCRPPHTLALLDGHQ